MCEERIALREEVAIHIDNADCSADPAFEIKMLMPPNVFVTASIMRFGASGCVISISNINLDQFAIELLLVFQDFYH